LHRLSLQARMRPFREHFVAAILNSLVLKY
jgi:hypothetical protein